MTTNRTIAGVLSLVLMALLAWLMIAGIGDLKTRIILAMGATFGLLYTALGRLPDWIVTFSSGSITEDEDPANISPRVYLPIILGVILVAVLVGCVALVIL